MGCCDGSEALTVVVYTPLLMASTAMRHWGKPGRLRLRVMRASTSGACWRVREHAATAANLVGFRNGSSNVFNVGESHSNVQTRKQIMTETCYQSNVHLCVLRTFIDGVNGDGAVWHVISFVRA